MDPFMTNPPTLKGYVTVDGDSVVVWCKYCRRLHSHGHGGLREPLGAGDGHRYAHCHDRNSGYDETGYYIIEVGWFTSEEQRREYEREQAQRPDDDDN
jgi:hypothetical protein